MNTTRARLIVAITTAATVGLLVGVAYLFEVPPFSEGSGKILASEVCDSLGPPSQSVPTLESVLPKASSYAFDDSVTTRVDDRDDSYISDCFVSGAEKELMSARTQMMRAESAQSWIDGEIEQYSEGSSQLTSFEGGAKGVASHSVAAIFVPCTSAGKIPGGQYNLSVVIHLKQAGSSSSTKTRADLIELAKASASYGHAKAKCDMPSELDG